ncbi:HIT family protein [Actinoplanes xinjiangensis]|uniref:Diadenosine tetraphosphate (Ap4A) HIT family hydrolase n=1 Tax=Actinoplanes xinjiangensis TaxID=512350 RepID=A0A316FEG6_9ACTN|nr:hypothetical protein [Actinoplanes xinjiangensis]PWK36020.1 diadenosine tetraphosphate (Ap4A) HIT family hydrolase [Actinoplanes xinjiangensis]GIF42982.1 hypothetical protein Axi01nite_72930 [Actinoplanes xinjiangensis]
MAEHCTYCVAVAEHEPADGWVYRDEHWAVVHGPAETTLAGGLLLRSVRHFVNFADMTDAEAASFGRLLGRLDEAIHHAVEAERVHLVSTRDRVPHFHAWLYPRAASSPLRGTDFLAAAQTGTANEARRATAILQDHLAVTA